MSQIINAIPPNALLPVAGALVGWVGHMLWFRSERAHVAAGMARIRQFMRGNDEWLERQRRVFASAPVDPDVTGELVAVEETGLTFVVGENGPVLALSDLQHHDDEDAQHDDTDRPRWWATVVAFMVLAPLAFARRQLGVLWAYVQRRLKRNEEPYRGRHWMADVQHTGQFPVVNRSVPTQRTESE